MNQEHLRKITELRHTLHQFPELSLSEYKTKQILMDFIKKETHLEIVDQGRWFYALYRCDTPQIPPIAFRADFDALPMEDIKELPYTSMHPGISHRCGHDGHSAALAGFALELEAEGADQDVYLIFQHGEEIGAGGEECSRLLCEKNISEVYAFHNMSGYPEGSILVWEGTAQCASKGLTIRMEGTPAHASQPEDGKNPAGALSQLVLETERIRKQTDYDGMVLATVVQVDIGSRNFGMSAACGEVSMTLRANYERDMKKLEQRIWDAAFALAAEDGLKISYEESDVFPETVNEAYGVTRVRMAASIAGLALKDRTEPFRASEDFGYYLKQCPGAMFYIGNGADYPQIHTAGYNFNDHILEPAVEMFKALVKK